MQNQFLKYTAIGTMILSYIANTAQASIPLQDRYPELLRLETRTQEQKEFSDEIPDVIITPGIRITEKEAESLLNKPKK